MLETGDWSYLIFLAVYGVDSVLTIIHRLMLHENIGLPHRKHMYQLMANELKIPHVVVSLLYMVVQVVIVAVYLAMPGKHYAWFAGSVAVMGIGYGLFMRKYFKLQLMVKLFEILYKRIEPWEYQFFLFVGKLFLWGSGQ